MSEPLYLSKLLLPNTRYAARLAGDFLRTHHLVCAGLGTTRARAQALYATNRQRGEILVQSRTRPDWTHQAVTDLVRVTSQVKDISTLHEGINPGDRLSFELTAAPHQVVQGRQIPLRERDQTLAWLERRLAPAADFVDVVALLRPVTSQPVHEQIEQADPFAVTGRRPRRAFSPVQFWGIAKVTDPDAFRTLASAGIGPGKAYGFGLMRFTRA
jgi:CRISPR system Cascade subunit CasE